MNRKAMQELAEHIVLHPKEFEMDIWAGEGTGDCGLIGCLAGTACMLAGDEVKKMGTWGKVMESPFISDISDRLIKRMHGGSWVQGTDTSAVQFERRGAKLLGLTLPQAEQLFYRSNWPGHLNQAYDEALYKGNHQEMACIAAKVMKKMIDEEGEE